MNVFCLVLYILYKPGFRIIVPVSKHLEAIGAIIWKPLDRLNRPKPAALQVKGRRAGLGLAAVYLKGAKENCQESTVLGVSEIFKKSEELGTYTIYYTDTNALWPRHKKTSVEIWRLFHWTLFETHALWNLVETAVFRDSFVLSRSFRSPESGFQLIACKKLSIARIEIRTWKSGGGGWGEYSHVVWVGCAAGFPKVLPGTLY